MPTFEPGDIIKVPFPYVEKAANSYRPALVVSSGELQEIHGLLWVLMITSARNRGWIGDVEIKDLARAGLPVASVVRCAKIATIEAVRATPIGSLDPAQWTWVCSVLEQTLGKTVNN